MRFFNLFKKNKSIENPSSDVATKNLYASISKYNEYIIKFMGFQLQGDYAPVAAYQKTKGEIRGFLYIFGEDTSYALSSQQAVINMESDLEQKLARNEIKSYIILYHSQFNDDDNHKIAISDEEHKAITLCYQFKGQKKGKIAMRYEIKDDQIVYHCFTNFSKNQNIKILDTEVLEEKNYFEDAIEIIPPQYDNEIGLLIKTHNVFDFNQLWCGIFGSDTYQKPGTTDLLKTELELSLKKAKLLSKNDMIIAQLDYDDLAIKSIMAGDIPPIIWPVIKTENSIDIALETISEWENLDNLVAIVTGLGRETFALSFVATDYAENKETYHSQGNLQLKISGIALVLAIYIEDTSEDALKFSDDFCVYLPNIDLPSYACFDFIGILEDFKETVALEEGDLKGYIIQIRLISNPDFKDFFTIDVFVHKENMRFVDFERGMRLKGVIQLQGHLSNT